MMENISPTAIVATEDLEDLDLQSKEFPFTDDPLGFSGYSGADDYSAFKKLGCQRFFSREIRMRKDNSVAARELHVETN